MGLYLDLIDPSQVHERAIAYEPAYPLWSNGSAKLRHLVLPEGAQVDTTTEPWTFPVGTAFFKTFAFEDEAEPDGLHYVETRVLFRTEEKWELAAYGFRDDRSDADLLDGMRATMVEVMGDGGEDTALTHEIPSRRQCRTCHESAPSPVLGFMRSQLGTPLGDGDGDQLAALHARGVLDAELDVPEALHEDADAAAVLGYVLGNCVHCHNGFAEGENSSFDLNPEVMLANTVDRETEGSASGVGVRIVPGKPDESVLYLAFVGEDNGTGIKAMPPLGVQRRDRDAAERLRQLIAALPAAEVDEPER